MESFWRKLESTVPPWMPGQARHDVQAGLLDSHAPALNRERGGLTVSQLPPYSLRNRASKAGFCLCQPLTTNH